MTIGEVYLTVKEAADILNLSHFTVRRYIWEKKLKATKIAGVGRAFHWRIRQEDLQEFVGRNTNKE